MTQPWKIWRRSTLLRLGSGAAGLVVCALCLLAHPVFAAPELALTREADRLVIEGATYRFVWELKRGGDLTQAEVHDGGQWVSLLDPAHTVPDFEVQDETGLAYRTSLAKANGFQVLSESPEEISFHTSCRPIASDGSVSRWMVEQTFRVFKVGIVFCDIKVWLSKGPPVRVSRAALGLRLSQAVTRAPHFRWSYDRPRLDQLRLPPEGVYLPPTESRKLEGEFFPLVRSAFGMSPGRGFTNWVDFVVEEGEVFAEGRPSRFQSRFGAEPGQGMAFEWRPYQGPPYPLNPPFVYRNRWGLGVSGARTSNAPGTPRVKKNKVIGQRIFHWARTSVGAGRYGEARWYPSDEEIDRIVAMGADILILHSGWMSKGGEGTRWAANYRPAHPDSLRRVVERCHRKGIRVAPYMRGLEYFVLDRDTRWFDEYLERDHDGVYVDWSTMVYPTGDVLTAYPDHIPIYGEDLDYRQATPTHVSALGLLLYTRKLRHLVGEEGFVIAHVGNRGKEPNAFGTAYFDTTLNGEWDTRFLESPLANSYFCPGNGCSILAANHAATRSREALAYYAACGNVVDVVLGGDIADLPDDPVLQFARPYWNLLGRVAGKTLDLHNNLSENRVVSGSSHSRFFSCVYRSPNGLLLLVAYLPEEGSPPSEASANIRLSSDLVPSSEEWGMEELVVVEGGSVQSRGIQALQGSTVRADRFRPHEFRGYLLVPIVRD